jgi:hypothetical protein
MSDAANPIPDAVGPTRLFFARLEVQVPSAGPKAARVFAVPATAACMLVTGIASAASAQEPSDLCTTHCIKAVEIAHLGALDDPASASVMPYVRWIGGRWWVIDVMLPNSILHYDRTGRWLGEIGRRGEGPGEFLWVRSATPWPGDSALVSEEKRRVHVVAADGTSRWIGQFGTGEGLVRLSNGQLLAPGVLGTADAAGYPLHLYASDGTHLKSFGTDRPLLVRSHRVGTLRLLSVVDGGFWAAQPDHYRLERWSNDGELLRTLEVEHAWFPPRHADVPGWDDARPEPSINAMHDDGEHLWVLMWVADADWQLPPPGTARQASARRTVELRDGLIEVVSKETGAVIARTRVDEPLFGFAGDRTAYSVRELESGLVQVVVWSLTLTSNDEEKQAVQVLTSTGR